jgi:hypothetical protein
LREAPPPPDSLGAALGEGSGEGVLPPPPSQDGGVEIDATIQFGAADCLLRLGRAPTIGPSARKNAKAAAACVLLLLLLLLPALPVLGRGLPANCLCCTAALP